MRSHLSSTTQRTAKATRAEAKESLEGQETRTDLQGWSLGTEPPFGVGMKKSIREQRGKPAKSSIMEKPRGKINSTDCRLFTYKSRLRTIKEEVENS